MNLSVVEVLLELGLSWPEALEMGMIACFGVSWPVSIARMLRLRRSDGKSLGFIALILLGYLLGIAAKIAYASTNAADLPVVTWLYAMNSVFVGVDGLLCFYFRRYPGAELHRPALPVQPQRHLDLESGQREGSIAVCLAQRESSTTGFGGCYENIR